MDNDATRGSYEVKPIVQPIVSNQKSAKEMFEELGYRLVINNENHIIYSKHLYREIYNYIMFYIHKKKVDVFSANINYTSVKGSGTFNTQELEATKQMCKELGWIE